MPKRKRKPSIPREPNGRPSRRMIHARAREALTEKEAKSVAIAARIRQTGLPEHLVDGKPEVGKPNVGTVQGRMALGGSLTADQWQAAEWYLDQRNAYQRSIVCPGVPSESNGAVGDSERYAEWVKDTRARWLAVRECLDEISIQVRSPVRSAFDVILERQQYQPHMEGDLKVGLNTLYRRFLGDVRGSALSMRIDARLPVDSRE